MALNEKNVDTIRKKPIKIVGINHGLVLHRFLLFNGWKKEQFTDLTFFCRSSNGDFVQNGTHKNKLHANRSVLAAVSPFFANLLPDSELELDVCISVELTFEEMSSVLEFIYSGKTKFLLQNKERILGILKDFGILPTNMRKRKEDVINIEETVQVTENRPTETINSVESILPHKSPSKTNEPNNQVISKTVKVLPNLKQTNRQLEKNKNQLDGNKRSKVLKTMDPKTKYVSTIKYKPLLPKPDGNISNNPATTPTTTPSLSLPSNPSSLKPPILLPMKSNSDLPSTQRVEKTLLTYSNKNQCLVNNLSSETRTTRENQETDNLPTPNVSNKEAVASALPNKSTLRQGRACDSVERVEPDCSLKTPAEQQSLVSDPSTSLISIPPRVYSHLKDVSHPPSNQNIAGVVIKQSDIQNLNQSNGKIHILLNAIHNPPLNPSVNPLFYSILTHPFPGQAVILNGQPPSNNEIDAEETMDKDDFILAHNFLKAELKRRRVLKKKLVWMNRRFVQLKDVAHSILKTVKGRTSNKNGNQMSVKRKNVAPKKKQCNLCGKMVAHLKNHLKIHSGIKSYLCDLCGRTFVLRNYLRAHKKLHHTERDRSKTFSCSLCDYTARYKVRLEIHERTHTGERPFECRYCDKKFREKGTLNRHLRTHTGEKPFECNICGKSYGIRESYLSHFKKKHETNIDSIPSRFRSKMRRCEFCNKSFRRILAYQKHLATHTGAIPSVCCQVNGCNFTYSEMPQLKDHMAVCHPEKTYTCTVCSKIFLNKQSLTLHQAKHDAEFGYRCSHCPKHLSSKASLIAHEKTHTRETPHGCSQCEMRFHNTYMLNLHIRKNHEPAQPRKRNRKKSVPVKNKNNSDA